MSEPQRNIRALRAAGVLLALLFGLWAGTRFYAGRAPASSGTGLLGPPAVRVPVGEASPPTPSDFSAPAPATTGTEGSGAMGPGGSVAPQIPEQLPRFSLRDRDGKPTSITQWSGKSLVVNFWATWCPPCRREIPLLISLQGEWGKRDVEVVGIAVDHRDSVVRYADELKIPYPLLVGEQDALDVAAQFGVDSPVFPFTVFTDRRGDVVTLYVGELHAAEADLILSVVQSVNDGQVQISDARRRIAAALSALAAARPG